MLDYLDAQKQILLLTPSRYKADKRILQFKESLAMTMGK